MSLLLLKNLVFLKEADKNVSEDMIILLMKEADQL